MRIIKTKSFELAVNIVGDEKSQKLAIILPGRLDTKDYAPFPAHQEFLAKKGFLTVSFDPPGTWDSPGGIELFTTTNYIASVNELIEYFGNKPTFLMGHSRGGLVAMYVGAINRTVVCYASVNGALGVPTTPDSKFVKNNTLTEYRDLPPGSSRTKEKKIFNLSLDYFVDGQKYDIVKELERSTKPKLFLYGKHDEFNTPEEVNEIFSNTPEPKVLHWLESKHDYRLYPEIIQEVNEVVGKFIDLYFMCPTQ